MVVDKLILRSFIPFNDVLVSYFESHSVLVFAKTSNMILSSPLDLNSLLIVYTSLPSNSNLTKAKYHYNPPISASPLTAGQSTAVPPLTTALITTTVDHNSLTTKIL